MSSNENLSLRFAEQLIALGRSTLSAPDSEQIRRLMLDALGVMLRGSGLPLSLSMRDWAKQFSQSGQAPVVAGGFTTAPAVAALVNATATHSYELDDTHDASMSHPGSVVIATALAMVAGTSISQAKLFSAIAAGYETIARVGMAANASLVIKAGFHPTALFGPFGAATTAAILQDVDAPTLACAWGHVLSLTGGSMQFSDETQGTEIKRLHAGYAAQNGILAAGMAFRGISAPSRALDGKYGFLIMYGHDMLSDCYFPITMNLLSSKKEGMYNVPIKPALTAPPPPRKKYAVPTFAILERYLSGAVRQKRRRPCTLG